MSYVNISERYGEPVPVIIEDYCDLNQNGAFEEHEDGIREYFEDGTWELVAVSPALVTVAH